MPTKLPLVPSMGYYDFTTTVDGYSLLFTIRWNPIDRAFFMDVADQRNRPIVEGEKIVIGAYIGRKSKHPLFTDGAFIAFDTAGNFEDAGYDDLGGRVEVWYYTANELVSAALGN
jgi:hypothetical protein